MDVYAGPSRRRAPSELGALERRGWWAEEKHDGCYVELHVGPCERGARGFGAGGARIALALFRSGRMVGRAAGRDVLGARVPWPPGTVLAGELMVATPAARRWQDAHAGVRGVVLFDVLRLGDWGLYSSSRGMGVVGAPARDLAARPYGERRGVLESLAAELEGPAARALVVAPVWRSRLRDRFEAITDAGGEGLVVRDPWAPAGRGCGKVKRSDTITARVVQVLEGEGVVRLDWGGRLFGASVPRFALAAGQLVDVRAVGFYDEGIPRHAVIERVRGDLG